MSISRRYYDPTTGRWKPPGPEGFNAGDSNLYRFARNAPTNATDPSGLRETDDRLTWLTNNLVNVSSILEKHVNGIITAHGKLRETQSIPHPLS